MKKIKYTYLLPLMALTVFSQCGTEKPAARRSIYLYTSDKEEKLLTRDYLNDSVFIDRLYMDYDKLVSTDTFKVINGIWYYADRGSFCEFFSERSFLERRIKRIHYDCRTAPADPYNFNVLTYKPFKVDVKDGKKIYVYERVTTSPADTTAASADNYCSHAGFDPATGFVYIGDEYCRVFKIRPLEALPGKWKLQ